MVKLLYRSTEIKKQSFLTALSLRDTAAVEEFVANGEFVKISLYELDPIQMQTVVEVFAYPMDEDTDMLNAYITNSNSDDLCFLFKTFPYWWRNSNLYESELDEQGEDLRIDNLVVHVPNGLGKLHDTVVRIEAADSTQLQKITRCFVLGLVDESEEFLAALANKIGLPDGEVGHCLYNPDDGFKFDATRQHFLEATSGASPPSVPVVAAAPSASTSTPPHPIWSHCFDTEGADDDLLAWAPADNTVRDLITEFLNDIPASQTIWIEFIKFERATLKTIRRAYRKLRKRNKYEEYNCRVSCMSLFKSLEYGRYLEDMNASDRIYNDKHSRLKILNNVFWSHAFSRKRKLANEKIAGALVADADSFVLKFAFDT